MGGHNKKRIRTGCGTPPARGVAQYLPWPGRRLLCMEDGLQVNTTSLEGSFQRVCGGVQNKSCVWGGTKQKSPARPGAGAVTVAGSRKTSSTAFCFNKPSPPVVGGSGHHERQCDGQVWAQVLFFFKTCLALFFLRLSLSLPLPLAPLPPTLSLSLSLSHSSFLSLSLSLSLSRALSLSPARINWC